MFWLVENNEQLEFFQHKKVQEAFIEIIPYHDHIHPAINGLSLMYLRPFNDTKGYMLCIDHSETSPLDKTAINALLQSIDKVWVQDKKQALYYFPLKNLLDLSILTPTYIQEPTKTHTYFYSKYPNYDKVNRLIPVVKHYERCENIYQQITKLIPQELPSYFPFYNNKVTIAFFGIEKNGLKINKYELDKHYELNDEFYSIKDNQIYTQYNLATTTRRPSNSFNGINFAALKKDNKSRASFIAEGKFIEYDISAYHPTIVGKLVGYDFQNQDVHQLFADLYGTDYDKAKEITFKQLYGGIYKEYEHLEFFQKVKKFIDDNWNNFNELGKVVVPVSGYYFEKSKLENMNPQKLFNYMLQNIESAINTHILVDIHRLLRGKKTKIILYVYDSMLFDVGEGEEDITLEIDKIFKKYKLTTKTKEGYNYDFDRK
jgi:hypothetical protein